MRKVSVLEESPSQTADCLKADLCSKTLSPAIYMLRTSLGLELFRINETYNMLVIVMYGLVRHGLLKHVLKPYERQFYIVEIAYDFFMAQAAHTIKQQS